MAPKKSNKRAKSKRNISEGAPPPRTLTIGLQASSEISKQSFSGIEPSEEIDEEDNISAFHLHGIDPVRKDAYDISDDLEDDEYDDGSNQIGQMPSFKSSSSNSSSIRSTTSIQTTTTKSSSGVANPLPKIPLLTMCSTTPLTKKPKKDSEVSLDESFNAIHVTKVVEFKDLHFSKTNFYLIVLF